MADRQRKTFIVTGAAQGLGRAIAHRLANADACIAVWDQKMDGAVETADLCRAAGAEAKAWCVDVGVETEITQAMDAVVKEWGVPYALINNAGIFPRVAAVDIDLALWNRVLGVNLTGTFLCARTAARHMLAAGEGIIVNTSSGRAIQGAVNGTHYASSKAGIIGLTKSLATEWAPTIRVNCVVPGISDTAQPREDKSDEELYAAGARIPLGRIGRPEDTANLVAFLVSDDASYMTGQSIAVNGGAVMLP